MCLCYGCYYCTGSKRNIVKNPERCQVALFLVPCKKCVSFKHFPKGIQKIFLLRQLLISNFFMYFLYIYIDRYIYIYIICMYIYIYYIYVFILYIMCVFILHIWHTHMYNIHICRIVFFNTTKNEITQA